MAPTAERKYKLATEQRTSPLLPSTPATFPPGLPSPRPSKHPRPARHRHVAGPRGSSSPRLRHRAPDVTLPEFIQASGAHDRSLLRAPAPHPDTTSARRAPLQTLLSHEPLELRPRPQPAATPRDRLQRVQRSTRGRRAQAPPPGADFLPEPERETCACARACGKRGMRLRQRFFPKAVGRMRCERPGRRRG